MSWHLQCICITCTFQRSSCGVWLGWAHRLHKAQPKGLSKACLLKMPRLCCYTVLQQHNLLCTYMHVFGCPKQVRHTVRCKRQVLVNSMQVLQSMPTIAAPPRAVEAAPAPWPAFPEEEAVLVVPALQEVLPLQPAKLAVYKLFTEQVRSHHTIPYHTIPYHTIPYHTIPYQMPTCVPLWIGDPSAKIETHIASVKGTDTMLARPIFQYENAKMKWLPFPWLEETQ